MCGCCCSRNFVSKDEKIEMLKDYKDSLENEIKGVEEKIQEMEKMN
jgi:prefoldin subunit 5